MAVTVPAWITEWYIRLAQPNGTTTTTTTTNSNKTQIFIWDWLFIVGLLLAEFVLGLVIIHKVPYTEIDWEAYMQEVSMWWEDGIYDYRQIRGSTGPLVYPAGFLYLFTLLRYLTNNGNDIRRAQYIFLAFYLMLQTLVLLIYTRAARFLAQNYDTGGIVTQQSTRSKDPQQSSSQHKLKLQQAHVIWSWRIAVGLCCCSKRLHSIFLLRLFNEGPTMILLWLCLYFIIHNHWNSGCCAFSYAVSLKMNVLLFAPGLLLLLIQQARGNLWLVVRRLLLCCALPQLVLGAPFLLTYPESYLRKAFELDRVFFYKWTVNWKFLDQDVFVSKPLAVALLACHLGTLVYFFCYKWIQTAKRQRPLHPTTTRLSPNYICYTMFVSNFVGIVFARTLHYQFYAWYCSSCAFLLWSSSFSYPMPIRIVLLAALEYAFLTFPATPTSSMVLQLVHVAILISIRPPRMIWEQVQWVDSAKDDKNAVDAKKKS